MIPSEVFRESQMIDPVFSCFTSTGMEIWNRLYRESITCMTPTIGELRCKMKSLKNLVVVVMLVVLATLTSACSKSPVDPVADVFSVASVTYEAVPGLNFCIVYVVWNVQYTNNTGFQKNYDLIIEWGDGESVHTGGILKSTVGVGIDTGKMNHVYLLIPGEVKVVNVKFTFTPRDSALSPIEKVIPITIKTK